MPSTKNTFIAVIMILISLLLISQFRSTTLFTNTPVLNETQGPTRMPEFEHAYDNKTLRVDVNVSPLVYTKMRRLSQMFTEDYGIKVDLRNLNTQRTQSSLAEQFKLQQNADVLLVNSEDVKPLAVRGWLLPNEQAMNGLEAGPDWMTDYTRWNGFTWAVPAYIDPYVFVWNEKIWREHSERATLPQTWIQWQQLLGGSASDAKTANDENGLEAAPKGEGELGQEGVLPAEKAQSTPETWFAWYEDDPFALLSLLWRLGIILPQEQYIEAPQILSNITTQGTERKVIPWQQMFTAWTPYRSAFKPLAEAERSKLWDGLEQGDIMFAVVPYSEAMLNLKSSLVIEEPQSITPPYSQWVRSSSYVIAANTELENEAIRWISYMLQSSIQLDMMDAVALMPANREAYEQAWPLMSARVPSIFTKGHEGLQELLLRSNELKVWSGRVLQWVKDNAAEEQVIEEWNKLWREPVS
ncbi:extracellular solute-binding protein [Paenibacillus marinisediminis]